MDGRGRAAAGEHAIVVHRSGDGYHLTTDGTERTVPSADLVAAVQRAEAEGARWVWDTAEVYPPLLAAGVRVARAWDLRLGRALLRRAAGTLGGIGALPADGWDDASTADDGALPIDLGGDLDPVAEFARQTEEVAGSTRPGALRLLITAESAGALAAVEMRHGGLPWRPDVHERILADLLGPRVPADRRPATLERLADEIRSALAAPSLNPDSPAELARALRLAGIEVESTRAADLRRVDHPAVGPLLEYKKLARLHQANGWAWLDTWVADGRFRPD